MVLVAPILWVVWFLPLSSPACSDSHLPILPPDLIIIGLEYKDWGFLPRILLGFRQPCSPLLMGAWVLVGYVGAAEQ